MPQVFYYALKAVVYPMAPVFDMQAGDGAGALTPFCTMALKRVFLMSDLDKARPPQTVPGHLFLSRRTSRPFA